MSEAAAQQPAKLDPETLVIRARPPGAIRFKRGVIIAIAAIGSVSLAALTWMALKPHFLQQGDTAQELSRPNADPASEVLNRVPSTYGDVPRLGPPLPGDLGKPILEHQQSMMTAVNSVDQQIQQAEAAERERELAELKAAREAGVLVPIRQTSSAADTSPAITMVSDGAEDNPKLALDPANDPNAQGRKAEFVNNPDPRGDVNPHMLTALPSPYTLSAGSVISASLITGLRSDLPGLVTAQVTENTYDSATGRLLLIPQGARLIGSYDSVVAFGQSRALIVWQRIIMPDGRSLRIDNVPATDPSGYAGLADKVDFHTWQLLKGVALSTLLGVSSELALSGQSDLVQRSECRRRIMLPALAIRLPSGILGCSRRSRSGRARRSGWWFTRISCLIRSEAAEMPEIKLAKLPDRTPVKLAITITPDLKAALDAYAALYAERYQRQEPVAELVPAMLASFLESDREFRRLRHGTRKV